MDGNGRWAAARGLPRGEGHRRGVEALRRTVRAAGELGIGILTIFSFSSENWSRPPAEVSDLMGLLRRFIRNDLAELHGNNVRVRVIGERDDLEPDILRSARGSRGADRATTTDSIWSSRSTTARARRSRARRAASPPRSRPAGSPPAAVDRDADRAPPRRARPSRPRPDHPHQRRAAPVQFPALAGGLFSELVFLPIYWPDFDRAALEQAIAEYRRRERRFGGLVAKTAS